MTECSACGAELAAHEVRCPTCGKTTAYYHRQRRCMHCGMPAARQTKTCMMCHKPVDSLPLDKSVFSGSWTGIVVGVLIVVGIVIGVNRYQNNTEVVQAVSVTRGPAATLTRTPTIVATSTETSTPVPETATPTFTPIPTATPRVHLVESGDSLLLISQRYGVPLSVLLDFNNISETDLLSLDQPILIPPERGGAAENSQLPLPPMMVYVVQGGDTLSDIAFNHGTTMKTIIQANPNLNLDLIFPGQEIIVPLSSPTPTLTPTLLPTETSTPGPAYPAPTLLTPSDRQVVSSKTLLLNWLSPRLLADDEFYVVQLNWPTGSQTEHWTKGSSLRISQNQRPTNGFIEWTVVIKHQIDTSPQGKPIGDTISPPGQTRVVEWR